MPPIGPKKKRNHLGEGTCRTAPPSPSGGRVWRRRRHGRSAAPEVIHRRQLPFLEPEPPKAAEPAGFGGGKVGGTQWTPWGASLVFFFRLGHTKLRFPRGFSGKPSSLVGHQLFPTFGLKGGLPVVSRHGTFHCVWHIGVLVGCFGRKIGCAIPVLPGGLIIYQGYPSISSKRTPMVWHPFESRRVTRPKSELRWEIRSFTWPMESGKEAVRLCRILSCSVAPILFPFFLVAVPLKMIFPKKGSLFSQGH